MRQFREGKVQEMSVQATATEQLIESTMHTIDTVANGLSDWTDTVVGLGWGTGCDVGWVWH